MNMRKCCICGRDFTPKTKCSVVCDSEECRIVHRRNTQNNHYKKTKPQPSKRKCTICGRYFTPKTKRSKVCFDPVCWKEHERRKKLKKYILHKEMLQAELELGDDDIPEPSFPILAGILTRENMITLATAVCINAANEKDWEWFYTKNGEWWMDIAGIDPDGIKDKVDDIIEVVKG